jgi:hypothetical protein
MALIAFLVHACVAVGAGGTDGAHARPNPARDRLHKMDWFFALDKYSSLERFDKMSLEDQLLVAQRAFFLRHPPDSQWLRRIAIPRGDDFIMYLVDRLAASRDDSAIQMELITLSRTLELLPDHYLTAKQYAKCAEAAKRVAERTVDVKTPLYLLQARTK